jgi:hypothetical protein
MCGSLPARSRGISEVKGGLLCVERDPRAARHLRVFMTMPISDVGPWRRPAISVASLLELPAGFADFREIKGAMVSSAGETTSKWIDGGSDAFSICRR